MTIQPNNQKGEGAGKVTIKMEREKRNILGWVQVAVTICLCLITVGAVPWIRGVNSELKSLRSEMTLLPEKMKINKLETADEIRRELNTKMDVIILSVQRIELELARHTAAGTLKP